MCVQYLKKTTSAHIFINLYDLKWSEARCLKIITCQSLHKDPGPAKKRRLPENISNYKI